MATTHFQSNPIETSGEPPHAGETAPDSLLVTHDLKNRTLHSFGEKKKLLNVFPSLDTPVCSRSIRTFHERLGSREDLIILNISMDLPFAATRFCKEHELSETIFLSAFRSDFPTLYGLQLTEGKLKGLLARSVFLLDKNNHVLYRELVDEISKEPDYLALLELL